jgi:hypothetical protein
MGLMLWKWQDIAMFCGVILELFVWFWEVFVLMMILIFSFLGK